LVESRAKVESLDPEIFNLMAKVEAVGSQDFSVKKIWNSHVFH
jgi:hypothetical protein